MREYDGFERMQEGCFIVGTLYKIVLCRPSSLQKVQQCTMHRCVFGHTISSDEKSALHRTFEFPACCRTAVKSHSFKSISYSLPLLPPKRPGNHKTTTVQVQPNFKNNSLLHLQLRFYFQRLMLRPLYPPGKYTPYHFILIHVPCILYYL